MYNRYVPGHNGVYERHSIPDPPAVRQNSDIPYKPAEECAKKEETAQQQCSPNQTIGNGMDLGDLLLLCIVVLLLIDSEEEERIPLLIMAAALLLQP